MSDSEDHLREILRSGVEEAAVRAVILHNSDKISNKFRLEVLRKEIRKIEKRRSDEGPGLDKAVRRQLRLSEELRNIVAAETVKPEDSAKASDD